MTEDNKQSGITPTVSGYYIKNYHLEFFLLVFSQGAFNSSVIQ